MDINLSRLLLALLLITMPNLSFSLPAFPGAKGFGSSTVGGRNGKVYRITSLGDSGKGTLREALTAQGRRIVVFAVEGRIKLKSEIDITKPYITIAGQTAPGQGVVISGARIKISTNDVIMRGLKVRVGDEDPNGGVEGRNRDNVSIGDNAYNVVIDSNSFTWSVDENLTVWGKAHDITLSNNIVAEALKNSIHVKENKTEKGPHSMGLLVGGSPDGRRVTVARNIMASNNFRGPEVKHFKNVEILNNFTANYGAAHQGAHLGGSMKNVYYPTTINMIGNVFEDGQNTNRSETRPPVDLRELQKGVSGSKVFFQDNYAQHHGYDKYHGGSTYVVKSKAFSSSNMPVMASGKVKSHVLANAGARRFGVLDPVDTRIIAGLSNGKAKIIDRTNQVGAYGVYKFSNQRETDTDKDGMPDWYERQAGHNVSVPDATGDKNKNGYNNIEDYFNSVLTGTVKNSSSSSTSSSSATSSSKNYSNTVKIEAEDMDLLGFDVANIGAASNKKVVQTPNHGEAEVVFDGDNGTFDITLHYFDENDGEGKLAIWVNGKIVKGFRLNRDLGASVANLDTLTQRTITGIALRTGDVVQFIADSDGLAEMVRLDYVVFKRKARSTASNSKAKNPATTSSNSSAKSNVTDSAKRKALAKLQTSKQKANIAQRKANQAQAKANAAQRRLAAIVKTETAFRTQVKAARQNVARSTGVAKTRAQEALNRKVAALNAQRKKRSDAAVKARNLQARANTLQRKADTLKIQANKAQTAYDKLSA